MHAQPEGSIAQGSVPAACSHRGRSGSPSHAPPGHTELRTLQVTVQLCKKSLHTTAWFWQVWFVTECPPQPPALLQDPAPSPVPGGCAASCLPPIPRLVHGPQGPAQGTHSPMAAPLRVPSKLGGSLGSLVPISCPCQWPQKVPVSQPCPGSSQHPPPVGHRPRDKGQGTAPTPSPNARVWAGTAPRLCPAAWPSPWQPHLSQLGPVWEEAGGAPGAPWQGPAGARLALGPRVPPRLRLLEAVPCPTPCRHPRGCAGSTCEMLQVVGARCWSSLRLG